MVQKISSKEAEILVVSYSRKLLGQTGDGHFASIGGYHPDQKLVLLFETARFKYPPHWVAIGDLWNAMGAIDEETGLPRGYVILKKDIDSSCQLLLATSVQLNQLLMSARNSGQ